MTTTKHNMGCGAHEIVTSQPQAVAGVFAQLATLSMLLLFSGCASKNNQMGVQNNWRGEKPPVFEKGQTTESGVMRALGPPSQIIALHEQTVFYYLREQLKTKSVFLLVYN